MSKKQFIQGTVFSILCLLMGGLHALNNDAYRNFWQPEYHGERLAYCSVDGSKCGQSIANQYCQTMGYKRALKSFEAFNVGLSHFMDSDFKCRGWQCKGFSKIECVELMSHYPPKSYQYRLRKFAYPRYAGYRVDWCYSKSGRCGRKPAYSFCRRIGYMNVKDYQMDKAPKATKKIGTQELCFGDTCRGYKSITCRR